MVDIAADDVGALKATVQRAAAGDETACAQLVMTNHAAMVRAAHARWAHGRARETAHPSRRSVARQRPMCRALRFEP